MDPQYLITIASAISTGLGGFVGGRMSGRSAASQIATDTVDMLQAQIELLKGDKDERELEIYELRSRVTVLEELVTQRADVEQVSAKVTEVKSVVDRIADKVGA